MIDIVFSCPKPGECVHEKEVLWVSLCCSILFSYSARSSPAKLHTSLFFSLDVLCEIFLFQMRDVEYPIHQFFTVEV